MLKVAGVMSKSGEVMKEMGALLKVPEMHQTIMDMQRGELPRLELCM